MRKILIVVDFQNDFVDGSLGFAGAKDLENPIKSLINSYEANGDEVVFTRDTHEKDYLSTEEGKNLPFEHCIEGTPGVEFYGEIATLSKNHKIFKKPTFPSGELYEYLRQGEYEEIGLCGLDTSICVLSNAVMAKAAQPNAHIKVYANASGSGDKEAEEVALKALSRIQVEIVR